MNFYLDKWPTKSTYYKTVVILAMRRCFTERERLFGGETTKVGPPRFFAYYPFK